jgi:hypothetical protein
MPAFDWRFTVEPNPLFAVCRACRMRCHLNHNPNTHHCDLYVAATATRETH